MGVGNIGDECAVSALAVYLIEIMAIQNIECVSAQFKGGLLRDFEHFFQAKIEVGKTRLADALGYAAVPCREVKITYRLKSVLIKDRQWI